MTKKPKNNIVSFFMRFGLSAILLAWLFSKIDFTHMWEAVKGADVSLMILATIVFFGINFIVVWRWIIIMKALDLKFKKFSSLRWFFLGIFCNLFLPTSIGGDVVKGMGLSKETGHKPKVFASILLDRLLGFPAIVLVSCFAFWGGRSIVSDTSIIRSIVAMSIVSIVLLIILLSKRIFKWTMKVFSFWPALKEGLLQLHYDALLMRGKHKHAIAAVVLSAFAQLVLAFTYYLIALAMHQNISLLYFMIFSPLVCVATFLPSIGGLGVREVGWVYLLSKVGVSQGVALGISLVSFGFMVMSGLIGGLFYVSTLSARRVQHHQPGAVAG